jgi:ABC-type transport system involved in multi-copper enzyme maturation permease subunit
MFASFTAELFKLRKRRVLWLIGGVWMVMTLVFGYVFPYFSYNGSPTGPAVGGREAVENVLIEALPQSLVQSAIQGFPMFAGALALIIGVLCVGGEYDWQTMKVVLTQGPRRLSVLGGKMAALLTVILIITVSTFVIDGTASWLVAAVESKPMNWPSAGNIVRGIGVGWLIAGTWASFGMFLGYLVRGTALGIGLGLVWALAVENLMRIFGAIVGPVDFAARYFPGTNAGALAGALGVIPQGQPGGTPGVTTMVNGTHAVLVLSVYVVAFAVIGGIILKRRDIA